MITRHLPDLLVNQYDRFLRKREQAERSILFPHRRKSFTPTPSLYLILVMYL